jgi:apolipoprotein N-acyltransferase
LRVVLAVFLGGAAVALALPDFNLWPLGLVALTFPVLVARRERLKTAFFIGWGFGTLVSMLVFTWIQHTLRVFGHMSWPMAVLGLFLFALYHGLAQALWLWAVMWLHQRAKMAFWVAVPLVYLPIECFFPTLFPWQLGLSLRMLEHTRQIADFTGAWGLTFLAALTAGALADLSVGIVERKKGFSHRVGLCVAAGLFAATMVYGMVRLHDLAALRRRARAQGRMVTFGMIQPNIGIYEKEREDGVQSQMEKIHHLSKKAVAEGAQVLVWPETAIQLSVGHRLAVAETRIPAWEQITGGILPDHVVFKNMPVISGGLTEERIYHYARRPDGKRTSTGPRQGREKAPGRHRIVRKLNRNVAFFLEPNGRIADMAVKNELLMFGEYLPFVEQLPWLEEVFPHAGNMTPGRAPRVMESHGLRVGVAICYEDIISGFVRRLAQKDPYVLVNLTNDSWFGKSREPYQHLGLAALRCIEVRRAMVRCTNTGVSAFIDNTGRIVKQTPIFVQATLVDSVPLYRGKTFFVRYGDWLVYLCLGLLMLLVVVHRVQLHFRRKPPPPDSAANQTPAEPLENNENGARKEAEREDTLD